MDALDRELEHRMRRTVARSIRERARAYDRADCLTALDGTDFPLRLPNVPVPALRDLPLHDFGEANSRKIVRVLAAELRRRMHDSIYPTAPALLLTLRVAIAGEGYQMQQRRNLAAQQDMHRRLFGRVA